MKYIATYENFNYQPTNEEVVGLLSAKTRNQYIKQGFDNTTKLIESDKNLQDKIMNVYESQPGKPSLSEMRGVLDVVKGNDETEVKSLEDELKSGEAQNESTAEPKTFIQKLLKVVSKIWNFGVNLFHFMGALAMILLPFTEKLGASGISSGAATGNTSLSWYGGLLMFGGIIAMFYFIVRKVEGWDLLGRKKNS